MGTNAAPAIANIALYYWESQYVDKLMQNGDSELAMQHSLNERFIDDIFTCGLRERFPVDIYPNLTLVNTTLGEEKVVFLGMQIISDSKTGKITTSIYDKTKEWDFPIVKYPLGTANTPRHLTQSLMCGQMARIRRITNNTASFKDATMKLTRDLFRRGHDIGRITSGWKAHLRKYGRGKDPLLQMHKWFRMMTKWIMQVEWNQQLPVRNQNQRQQIIQGPKPPSFYGLSYGPGPQLFGDSGATLIPPPPEGPPPPPLPPGSPPLSQGNVPAAQITNRQWQSPQHNEPARTQGPEQIMQALPPVIRTPTPIQWLQTQRQQRMQQPQICQHCQQLLPQLPIPRQHPHQVTTIIPAAQQLLPPPPDEPPPEPPPRELLQPEPPPSQQQHSFNNQIDNIIDRLSHMDLIMRTLRCFENIKQGEEDYELAADLKKERTMEKSQPQLKNDRVEECEKCRCTFIPMALKRHQEYDKGIKACKRRSTLRQQLIKRLKEKYDEEQLREILQTFPGTPRVERNVTTRSRQRLNV
jgi:hypothetical protein